MTVKNNFNIFNRQHIMIDLETLSKHPNAAIVSIGAVKFTFEDGLGDEFLINISPKSNAELKLHFQKDTIEWWNKQPKETREMWQQNPQHIRDALISLNDFVGVDKKRIVWAQGAAFDFSIIHSAYIATNLKWPVEYWNECDSRTVFTLLGIRNDKIRATQTEHHSSLGDAKSQALTLINAFKVD